MSDLAWALWLAAPFAVTLLAGGVIWWRGRPRRAPTTRESIAEHQAYLDALEDALEHVVKPRAGLHDAQARELPR